MKEQSIGRMLRMHDEKEEAILYDIVDDLSHKSHMRDVITKRLVGKSTIN